MITPDNMLQYMDRVTPQWIAGLFDGDNKGVAADIVRKERSLCRDKIVEINAANRAKSA